VSDTRTIDDFGPLPVERPGSAAELGDVVRRAAAEGKAVYPVGGGTQLDYGRPPRKPGYAVELGRLAQVIDYPARDMTITVEAGLRMGRLQEVLAAEKQWLPIDADPNSTIGGVIATNTSGPRRYGYGTLRDYVIGISFVTDEGTEVKGGGRVVKNVAGYDLCKLQIGALGTLGVLTQVTLKVKPKPEQYMMSLMICHPDDLETVLETIHRSRVRPSFLDLKRMANNVEGVITPDRFYSLDVGFEEKREAVGWQVEQFESAMRDLNYIANSSDSSHPGWAAGTQMPRLLVKASVLPSRLTWFLNQISPLATLLRAYPGNGIVEVWLDRPDVIGYSRAAMLVRDIRQAATEAGGHAVIARAPADWKKHLSVWGPPRSDWALMRAVKDKLDPQRIFNPDRYLDTL
jgi:glycolate oxidase FAD binding subunit